MGVLAGEVLAHVHSNLPGTAVRAAGAVGNRWHGVDLKEGKDDFVAIEVNDHTTVVEGGRG
jgi:glutathione synthase/RimK-type ligase-like ATP-grasp enzyme